VCCHPLLNQQHLLASVLLSLQEVGWLASPTVPASEQAMSPALLLLCGVSLLLQLLLLLLHQQQPSADLWVCCSYHSLQESRNRHLLLLQADWQLDAAAGVAAAVG
jgi:hypothetical protein